MNLFILIPKKTELMSSKCVFLFFFFFFNKILENSRLEVAGPELYVSGVEVGGEGWSWVRRGVNRTGLRAHALKESSGKRPRLQLIGWGAAHRSLSPTSHGPASGKEGSGQQHHHCRWCPRGGQCPARRGWPALVGLLP